MAQQLLETSHTSLMHEQAVRLSGGLLEVTSDLACLPLSLVNVYMYGQENAADRGWALIDAGLVFSANTIRSAAESRFGSARPAAIILTHGHFDHVGALPYLADYWQAPIFAHKLELPYLTGRSAYPPPDPAVGGGAMAFLSRLYPRGPYDFRPRIHPLPEDGTVPGMPGWRWVHTPGHAPGHVSLFRDSDRALIVGDAFVTQKQESMIGVLTQAPGVRRPPAYFTPDWEAAYRSVALLAQLRPEIAATGHGVPMYGEEMRSELNQLVHDWSKVAVPAHGRYVNRPALMDEGGVVSVPSSVWDPTLLKLAALGLGAVAGGIVLRKMLTHRRTHEHPG